MLEILEARTLLAADYPWPTWPGFDISSAPERSAATAWVPGLGWQVSQDAFLADDRPLAAAAPVDGTPAAAGAPAGQAPYGATQYNTSEFMLGDVWVTVVLFESDGSIDQNTEDWTTGEISQVHDEVLEGLTWWQDTLATQFPGSKSQLEFHVDFTYADTPVATGYEPITRSSSDLSLWGADFLRQVGADTSLSLTSGLRAWNHNQRLAHNADWAYTIFVVDSSNDTDGEFRDGRFAFAYLGGPFLVMTYDNDGWGSSRMGMVLAHESGHVFYACDEYPSSDSYSDISGYYGTRNLNAFDGNPDRSTRVASIMAESALQGQAYPLHTSSPSSLAMLGWRDSDTNGVFDVLDVPLSLSGSGVFDEVADEYTFAGSSHVNTLPNLNPYRYGNDITLNTVDILQYRFDGGEWWVGQVYGAYSTDIATVLSTRSLGAGTHTVDIRTLDNETGVTSNVLSDSFQISTVRTPPTVAVAAAADPNPVPGNTTAVSVLGDSPGSEASLIYTWFVATRPDGAELPTFSHNGTNAAKQTTVTFSRAGVYGLNVIITDADGLTANSSVRVTVAQTLTSIEVQPAAVEMVGSRQRKFTAIAKDQFGAALTPQPAFTWTASVGTVSSTGLFTAPRGSVSGTVTAQRNDIPGTAAVTVIGLPNHAPTAGDNTFSTLEDTAATFNVLLNDSDPDGDVLTVIQTSLPGRGTVAINPNNTLTYKPAANLNGLDSFTYTISDGWGGTATATVTVTVISVNDPPVAKDDSITTPANMSVTIPVLTNDTDVDGDALKVSGVGSAGHGSVSFSSTSVTYHPKTTWSGADAFTYTLSDGKGGTAQGTVRVTVTPPNHAPVASADTVAMLQNRSAVIKVLSNDRDVDGDPLAVTGAGTAKHGVVAFTAADMTYTPQANWFGTDKFTYTVADGRGGKDTATVTVKVAAVVPVPPSSLSATAVSPQQISLAWIDNSGNETGFRIERSLDGVNFTTLATVGANVVRYTNSRLTPGTTYHYRVRAINSAGASEPTSVTAATTLRLANGSSAAGSLSFGADPVSLDSGVASGPLSSPLGADAFFTALGG